MVAHSTLMEVDPAGMMVTFVVIGATLAYIVTKEFYERCLAEKKPKGPWKKVPGSVPFLGNFPQIKSPANLVKVVEQWATEYAGDMGCFEMELPGRPVLVVCREDLVAQFSKYRPLKVVRSSAIVNAANSVGALGVFSAEGEVWQKDRKVFAPALSHKNVRDFVGHIQTVTKRLVNKWKRQSANAKPVTINADCASFVIDVISLVAYGNDTNTLESAKKQLVLNDIETSIDAAYKRALSPIPLYKIPLVGNYLDGNGTPINRLNKTFHNLVKAFAHEDVSGAETPRKGTFLDKLFQLSKESESYSDDRLVGQLITMYLGATDSTASMFNTLIWQLCIDETGLQDELAKEIASLTDKSLDGLMAQLPRLRSFIYETLRVYPAFSFVILTTKDELLFQETLLPQDLDILLLHHYANVDPKHPPKDLPLGPSGEAAETFCPRRWLVENKKKGQLEFAAPSKTSTAFMAFGLGARNCPGRILAEAEFLVCLSALLPVFRMSLKPNHPPIGRSYGFSEDVDCDIEVVLVPRRLV